MVREQQELFFTLSSPMPPAPKPPRRRRREQLELDLEQEASPRQSARAKRTADTPQAALELGCSCCVAVVGAPHVGLDGPPCPRCSSPAPRRGHFLADVDDARARLIAAGWTWGPIGPATRGSNAPAGLLPPVRSSEDRAALSPAAAADPSEAMGAR